MANFVANVLHMEGIADLPIYSEGENGKRTLDFNKIIPMPDSLNIEAGSQENEALDALMEAIKSYRATRTPIIGRSNEPFGMEPDPKKLAELGLRYAGNVIRHGMSTWYDWRRRFWGTKWNAMNFKTEDADTVRFDTAWTPPLPVIEKLAEMFPGKEIELTWADEGIGSNTGHLVIGENGEEVEFVEYEDNSQQAYEACVLCWQDVEELEKVDGLWRLAETE